MLLHRPGWEAVGAAALVWEASLPPAWGRFAVAAFSSDEETEVEGAWACAPVRQSAKVSREDARPAWAADPGGPLSSPAFFRRTQVTATKLRAVALHPARHVAR